MDYKEIKLAYGKSGLQIQIPDEILTGFIEPHFFAGFSGGGKALMPGMAYLDSIRYNHSIRNLENPRARWGHTYGNRDGGPGTRICVLPEGPLTIPYLL